jgi:hypothetical protein
MFNITDSQARQQWQLEVERIMLAIEFTYAKRWRQVLNRQFLDVAKTLETEGRGFINTVIDEQRRRLLNLIFNQYKRTATVFSRRAFKELNKLKSFDQREMKTPEDEFWRELNVWMATEAGKKITAIQETTKNVIAKIIGTGMNEGESTREIAKRIRKTGAITNVHRSHTIALTETHTAAVKSMDSSVKSTRIKVEREWVSARDDRTRRRSEGSQFEHFVSINNGGPNGERVLGFDEKFQKTGEPMAYPGDPNGSVGNIVRCRCVTLYHTVR